MKVLKFGGACLKDKEMFLRTGSIIKEDPQPKIIVASAIYRFTDALERSLKMMFEDSSEIDKAINTIRTDHETLAMKLIEMPAIAEEVQGRLQEHVKKLERLLYGVLYTEELTKRTRAFIMSFGERLSIILLEGYLRSQGLEARAFPSEEAGLITDDNFDNATAIMPETEAKLQATLGAYIKEGGIPIVTGFYGVTQKGWVTTFGRNGSDYSAAVIAAAMKADSLEVWKDVKGFMSADPNLVPDARPIERLSYYEAAELSYFGAKILHPRTVEPLIETHMVPITIKNILDQQGHSTLITQSGIEEDWVIKSVTYNPDLAVLKILGPGVGYKPGIISDIGKALSDTDINIYSIITSQTCINLLLDNKDSEEAVETVSKLAGGVIEKVEIASNRALIGLVGQGLINKPGLAARVFTAVANENVNVEMISAGASKVAYYFIIDKSDLERTMNAIHAEYF